MAFITNGGAKLIDRARNEGKALVFGAVRMNTIYESNPSELVQKSDSWFGENVGEVVGCLSHVSVDEVSHVCDSKLAIQCNDNGKPWKSIGIYGHLEGESGEILISAESIQNGDYKNVTIIELPVTLDGAVEDWGIQGGGGGGGDVPANMMTTNTEQAGLYGLKQWELQSYLGGASVENPDQGDLLNVSHADIGDFSNYLVEDRPVSHPIQCSNTQNAYLGDQWESGRPSYAKLSPLGVLELDAGDILNGESQTFIGAGGSVKITSDSVQYQNPMSGSYGSATWSDIIDAANGGGGGGGDVPENMMTIDTDQMVSGVKIWSLQSYIGEGGGSVEEPMEGDRILDTSLSLGNSVNNPIAIDTLEQYYSPKDGWYDRNSEHLQISSSGVTLGGSNASWGQIINAARTESRFDHATVTEVEGVVYIDGDQFKPNSDVKIGPYCLLRADSNGHFESVCSNGSVLDISVAIRGNGIMHRVSGIVDGESCLPFESPITPVDGQEIFIHWTRYAG